MNFQLPISRFHNKGFTVIELMVTISIFLLVTTSILIEFPQASSRISLDLLAHDIALTVRQSQIFALSVKSFLPNGVSVPVFPAYGIHFDKNRPNSFILFADLNDNNSYDAIANPNTNEFLEQYQLSQGATIVGLCKSFYVDVATLTYTCSPNDTIDVVFRRPDPEAFLGASGSSFGSAAVGVEVKSGSSPMRAVVIYSSGQIQITPELQ